MGEQDAGQARSERWLPIAVYAALAIAAAIVFAVAWRVGVAVEAALQPARTPTSATAPIVVPPSGAGVAVPPRGNVGRFFSANNYPPEAIRRDEQGRVVAMLTVSPRGTVSACAIRQSSGSASLDAATCRIALDRIRFDPALDRAGRPTVGSYTLPVRWVLPQQADAHSPRIRPSSHSKPLVPAAALLVEAFVIGQALKRGAIANGKGKPLLARTTAPTRYWMALGVHAVIAGGALFGVLAWVM